ncbi:MAG TPA: ABC transporter permease [Solirubrobacterales bacterium]|nr:ABC transporter permease [Solirubrobacterales bacterium]
MSADAQAAPSHAAPSRRPHSWLGNLSYRNIGAVYVWLLLIVIFTIWKPSLFPTDQTAKSVVNQYAITGLAALAVVMPLAAGVFDLSIGATIGFAGVFAGWSMNTLDLPVGLAVALTLVAGLAIGTLNALVVVKMNIDSFIGTLATGSIIGAATLWVSGDEIITGKVSGAFTKIASTDIGGVQLPVIYMLVAMLVLGFVLEQTVFGRRVYASGYGPEVSRLVGLRVGRIRTISLLFSGLVGSFAGIALASRIGSADPSVGPEYLIPAFSAAFVGASQFRHGRFNPWGTVVAVLMIGTGSVGLLLAGTPNWTPQVFQGAVLIAAVGITQLQRRRPVAD